MLTEHGVLVGLSLSAIFFVGVSLATRPPEKLRLAPFFPDVANEVFRGQSMAVNKNSFLYREVMGSIKQKISGDRAHLNLSINLLPVQAECAHIPDALEWNEYVERLKLSHPRWYTPTGSHIIYRSSQADMLASIKMVREDLLQTGLSAEPRLDQI